MDLHYRHSLKIVIGDGDCCKKIAKWFITISSAAYDPKSKVCHSEGHWKD